MDIATGFYKDALRKAGASGQGAYHTEVKRLAVEAAHAAKAIAVEALDHNGGQIIIFADGSAIHIDGDTLTMLSSSMIEEIFPRLNIVSDHRVDELPLG